MFTAIGSFHGMDMNYKCLSIICCIIIMASCQRYDARIENAISQSGNNANGYIQLLEEYRTSDTLKYKAASFLIANMPYHISDSTIIQSNEWRDYVSSYLIRRNDTISDSDRNEAVAGIGRLPTTTIFANSNSDIATLSPKFLKNHIDYSFHLWKTSPYCKNLLWEEFIEYILPYRSIQEPVYFDRESLSQIFFNSIINRTDSESISEILLNYKNKARFIRLSHINAVPRNWGVYTPFLPIKKYDCNILSAYTCDILRAIGVPVSINFTPQWDNCDVGHTWCVTRDSTNRLIPFSPPYINIDQEIERVNHAPKIYQICFGVNQHAPCIKLKDKRSLPTVLNSPLITDVTDSFLETATIRIPANQKLAGHDILYLSVFNKLKENFINPVAWGYYDSSSDAFIFEKVPINQLFFPTYFNSEDSKYNLCLKPFIVRKQKRNGLASYSVEFPIQSSFCDNAWELVLTRKYPVKDHIKHNLKDIEGSAIVASNSLSGKCDTLMTLCGNVSPYMQRIVFSNKNPYRFYRIIGKNNNLLHIAEHQWLSSTGKNGISCPTLPILTYSDTIHKNSNYGEINGSALYCDATSKLSYDKNPTTYSESPWIGVDFGQPVLIDGVQFLPRNSSNGIIKGNSYELYYFKDNKWHRHSAQNAIYNFIVFENVPPNTLYWLRNLTEGKEELPFFYNNGEQVFIDNL